VTEVAELAGLYKDLHAHPELAFAEHRTAALAAARLRTGVTALTCAARAWLAPPA
jgi:hippurate hydrolase